MRLGLILGDQRRHLAVIEALANLEIVKGIVVQTRPELPIDVSAVPTDLVGTFRRHFELRREAEHFFFSPPPLAGLNHVTVSGSSLNSRETVNFLRGIRPDLVLSFGCNLISSEVIEAVGVPFWNVHGGLSPRYRGSATLFWPVYFLEPQWCGVTLHETVKKIDAGPIIHQVSAKLIAGDGLQMHSSRVVADFLGELPALMVSIISSGLPRGAEQRSTGKLFLSKDWRPQHLSLIYKLYGDEIIALAANGQLGELSSPPLHRNI